MRTEGAVFSFAQEASNAAAGFKKELMLWPQPQKLRLMRYHPPSLQRPVSGRTEYD
jgi:hypothetical protein